jgi:hypothetical protein
LQNRLSDLLSLKKLDLSPTLGLLFYMTGIAVIKQGNSIPFQTVAIENMAVESITVNLPQNNFYLDSEKIKEIQKSLKKLGLYKGKNSGRLNKSLERSVRLFQTSNGLENTGIITVEVYKRLVDTDYAETQLILDSKEKIEDESFEDVNQSNYMFANLATYPIHISQSPIHISQQPRAKSKDDLYLLNGKDDFLFIGVFLLLIAVSIVAAIFMT